MVKLFKNVNNANNRLYINNQCSPVATTIDLQIIDTNIYIYIINACWLRMFIHSSRSTVGNLASFHQHVYMSKHVKTNSLTFNKYQLIQISQKTCMVDHHVHCQDCHFGVCLILA